MFYDFRSTKISFFHFNMFTILAILLLLAKFQAGCGYEVGSTYEELLNASLASRAKDRLRIKRELIDEWWDQVITTRDPTIIAEEAKFLGFNYAGASEFPWLVDIRTVEGEFDVVNLKEEWGVGNIIASRYVLTACAVVVYFEYYRNFTTMPLQLLKNKDSLKVLFAPTFLYAKESPVRIGTRYVRRMASHPDCDLSYLMKYNFGMIELERAVIANPPFISYMPVILDVIELKYFLYYSYSNHWVQCFVASWGRSFSLQEDNKNEVLSALTHYKVRYSVRVVPMKRCQESVDYYNCTNIGCTYPNKINLYYMRCMQVYDEKVAAVCEHDHGAPVVCRRTTEPESDWTVLGIVVRGASGGHCDIRKPRPFMVNTMYGGVFFYQHVSPYRYAKYIVPDYF